MPEGKPLQQKSKQKTGFHPRKSSEDIKKTPEKYVDHTLAYRYEMKYLISESKAQALVQFIKPYLQLDRYCKLQPGWAYPIVSLYLDSDNLQLAQESLTGQKNRFKLRIRGYTDDLDYPRFFEIKRRINNIIIKNRARVMPHDVATVLSGMSLPPQNYSTDEETLKQFQLYIKNINAQPTILVRYMRQAFEDSSENRIRLTFDRELSYKVTKAPEIKLNSPSWQHHSYTLGRVILEIKFTARYPAWLSRMVEFFNLGQESISKYVTSIKQSCQLGFCAPQLQSTNHG